MTIKIDKLIRSKRKTIALQISSDAELIVRAPLKVSIEYIQELMREKQDWIHKKQKEIQEKIAIYSPKNFMNGEEFLFLGERYKLRRSDEVKGVLFLNNEFLLSKNSAFGKEWFTAWYKKTAFEKISERVDFYTKITGWKCGKIKLSNAKTRWGSCSFNGNLNFNWRLIMAPLVVIDYVVTHELVHLKHKDHSERFWRQVEMIMPDYKKHRKWLKENGQLLTL